MRKMNSAKIGTIVIVIITIIIAIVFNKGMKKIEISQYSPEEPIFEESILKELPKNSQILQFSKTSLEKYKKIVLKDKSEKIILPYTSNRGDKSINLLIMSKEKNKWVEEDTLKILGESIENIYIEDLNQDGDPEVILGINLKNNETKGLAVYGFENNNMKELFTDSYDELYIENMDNDNRKEVILSKSKGYEDSNVLITYYSINNKNTVITNKYAVNNYVDMRIGKTKSNEKYILLEYITEDKEKRISLLRIIKNKFVEVNDMKLEYIKTDNTELGGNEQKTENQHEYIEIPVEIQTNKAGSLVRWETIDDNYKLHLLRLEFMNLDKGFYFEIPDYWNKESLSIYEKSESKSLESYYVNDGGVGLCVDVYKNANTEKSFKDVENEIIAKTDRYTFVLNVAETTDEKLKEKDILYLKSKFKIISENEKIYYK